MKDTLHLSAATFTVLILCIQPVCEA